MRLRAFRASGQRRRRWAAGFTLAEVIVSTLVLAISGAAICLGISSGFSFIHTTREDLRATQILVQKIEAVRLCTWSQLTSFSFQEPYDPLRAAHHSDGAVFLGRVSINPAGSIPNTATYSPNMRLVTVSLSWTNYNGSKPIAHFRQMQTQVARYGLQQYLWGTIQ
jgi:hypothetical protein